MALSEYERQWLHHYIESIRQQLRDLNQDYQLNYIFGYAYSSNDLTREFKRGLFYNRLINMSVLNNFIMDLIKLKRELDFWLTLIQQGRQVVFTLRDSTYINGLDEIYSGEFYLIRDIIIERIAGETNIRYTLFGRDSGVKEGGYDYRLFVRMFSLTQNN